MATTSSPHSELMLDTGERATDVVQFWQEVGSA